MSTKKYIFFEIFYALFLAKKTHKMLSADFGGLIASAQALLPLHTCAFQHLYGTWKPIGSHKNSTADKYFRYVYKKTTYVKQLFCKTDSEDMRSEPEAEGK